ncbi:MAG: UvrD-helicase domain-containing protein [Deltaproteobacteria bacterium]|nr:UvrD-helicase domain-containing protein [Deltaproteobacteria bacterium]MBI3294113.1 UvrD-helicase domain-containing protein [Deltaproteobacteria bacterium]
MSPWLKNLNEEQREAALHNEGPLLILAGAGSGKTTVLVSRAGRLIDEGICPAKRLCVLTFTNKAARELKARVAARLGEPGGQIWAGTFHSFGLSLLRKFSKASGFKQEFGVVDATDSAAIAKELMGDFHNAGKTAYDSRRLIEMISQWRHEGRLTARGEDEYEAAVEWLMPRYFNQLDRLGVVDFDGLLQRPIDLIKRDPEIRREIQQMYDQVMVDEFQDTNATQMKLVRLLSESHNNLSVVGDDDQSIYGWRGACIKNILDFPKNFKRCKVVRLERNYRSTEPILKFANAAISRNVERHVKVLKPHLVGEAPAPKLFVYQNETEEAEGVCGEIRGWLESGVSPKEIAVLYRSNSIGASLEAELRKNSIPYAITGGTAFFDRKETRDALAYLRMAFRPSALSLRRMLTSPPRGVGGKSLELLEVYAHDHRTNLVRAARRWREAGVEERAGRALDDVFTSLESFAPACVNSPKTSLLGLLEQSGYRKHLEKRSSDALQGAKRWRMIEIFADVFERMMLKTRDPKDFIDAMELRDHADDEEEQSKINLMTLHASKGLEFQCVILVGVEEEILPHRTLGLDVAEERRLFYVGVTRAKRMLYLTHNRKRNRFGGEVDVVPSRFLIEIPRTLYQMGEPVRKMSAENRKAMLNQLYETLGV